MFVFCVFVLFVGLFDVVYDFLVFYFGLCFGYFDVCCLVYCGTLVCLLVLGLRVVCGILVFDVAFCLFIEYFVLWVVLLIVL